MKQALNLCEISTKYLYQSCFYPAGSWLESSFWPWPLHFFHVRRWEFIVSGIFVLFGFGFDIGFFLFHESSAQDYVLW